MNPHVLILLENEGYPHDRKVRQQAEALVQAGYRVTVVCPTGYGHDAPEETMGSVRVVRYAIPREGSGALGYVREYALSLLRIWRTAKHVARSDPPDVVVPCSPPDLLAILARRLVRRGGSVLFDHHDLSPELFERKFGHRGVLHRLLLLVERAGYRSADVVLEPNDSYVEIATRRGRVARERVFLVRHGADTDVFFPVQRRPELRRSREKLVLWMGNITALERVLPLIDAADELVWRRGRSDVGFALVGSGEARGEVIAEVRRRKLEHAIDLPGAAYGEDLRSYLATADVCLSVDVRNAMNEVSTVTKVIDYMTMGRPVVQFPLDEMLRICGDATLYAREGDRLDLADKVEELLDDPERATRLGSAGRDRVLKLLAWNDQVPVLYEAVRLASQLGRGGSDGSERGVVRWRPA